jgi:hypothetical protein
MSAKTTHLYLIDTDKMTANRVDVQPARVGQLEVHDNHYQMDFPASATAYAARVRVNRYSGKIELEFGTAAFDQSSVENVFQSGQCELSDVARKF